jgi:hypothetical protein
MAKLDESVAAGAESVARRRRGKWTAQQRRRIVADSRVAGASVHEVAADPYAGAKWAKSLVDALRKDLKPEEDKFFKESSSRPKE